MFHQIHCQACAKLIRDVIPPLADKFGGRVRWTYLDILERENYEIFLQLEKDLQKGLGTPTVVVGRRVLIGLAQNADKLGSVIEEQLKQGGAGEPSPLRGGINIFEHFRSFGPLAVIGAGLVDGINPCAFTVIVFFVSFLSVMGYRRREMAVIGLAYILAVFVTYLAIGLGLFNIFYRLDAFFLLSRGLYFLIGALSMFLGGLAVRDYLLYKKTGKTDDMALQLPGPVKRKIHALVGEYYRKTPEGRAKALGGLFVSALVVGFLISLLEAVCTGQLYLPTIVIVLKEGSLRARALFYLVLYNFMFIIPLVGVLSLALLGTTSRDFEGFAKKRLGLIKITMAAVFLGLGLALWSGLF
ncbi:MAG: hypothetical protein PHS61_07660 [Candidatus Omnitrophica bacterium]|nr:hypothetical protein [Candidatus Omnitrophota bacterium]